MKWAHMRAHMRTTAVYGGTVIRRCLPQLLTLYLESSAKVRHGIGRNAHEHFLSARGKKEVNVTQDELEISMRKSDRIHGSGP